jgi:hypothetical protein
MIDTAEGKPPIIYSVLRMLSYICTQSPYPLFTIPSIYQIYLCIHLLYTYVMPCHCHIIGNKLYQLSTSSQYNNVIHIDMTMTGHYIRI